MYTAIRSFPGCLPDTTEPAPLFETVRAAWDHLMDEREDADVAWEPMDKSDPDGPKQIDLVQQRMTTKWNHEVAGTVVGDGQVYEVARVECECAYVPGDSSHEFHCPLRSVDVLS